MTHRLDPLPKIHLGRGIAAVIPIILMSVTAGLLERIENAACVGARRLEVLVDRLDMWARERGQ